MTALGQGQELNEREVVQAFAVDSWQAHESGDLNDQQTVKKAVTLAGRLNSLALAEGISPPEGVVRTLNDEAAVAVFGLLAAATSANDRVKKPTDPNNMARINRILANVSVTETEFLSDAEDEGDHLTEETEGSPITLTLDRAPTDVARDGVTEASSESAIVAYTDAMRRAEEHFYKN